MNTLTITVNNETIFDKIIVEANISKLVFQWGSEVLEWHKSSLNYKLKTYLYSFLQKNSAIKVLDLSRLVGLKEAYYPIKYLHEIYYPDSIESVSIYKNRSLKKVSAYGAKKITINQVPTLDHIEFGSGLEELSLAETGIIHIELPKNVRLRSGAFKGCRNLQSVILKSGTDVPPSSFEDCSCLYEITLPDDLLVIEPNVFCGCSNLRYIYGGKSVKQIFPSAFEGCFSLGMMECKNFYKFTDLNVTDKQWLDKFRPYTPLANVRDHIKKFTQELREKKIDNPTEYIADYFFHETENHFGIVMEYQSRIRSWMVWSLSHNRFLATKGEKYHLHQDEIVTFTIERKPSVIIEDNLCFQFPMLYIDDASSLKQIERDGEDSDGFEFILEYLKPRVSLLNHYKEIVCKIDSLNISQIIDSYTIKERTWWHVYPGRDDSQFYERIAKSDYSDAYLETLLPQEKSEDYYNGCRPIGFDEQEETRKMQESADAEAKSLRENAHKLYSKDAHICKLLEDYINKRRELEKDIESRYHIQAIKNFLHCRYVDYGEGENSLMEFYGYTIDDILKDTKYNERVSWSYKHGWVDNAED